MHTLSTLRFSQAGAGLTSIEPDVSRDALTRSSSTDGMMGLTSYQTTEATVDALPGILPASHCHNTHYKQHKFDLNGPLYDGPGTITWYCCSCGDGPKGDWQTSCASCGHIRDSGCTVEEH